MLNAERMAKYKLETVPKILAVQVVALTAVSYLEVQGYAAFFLIFPAAQRFFISTDNFLRAAALR
jgi:hypothetical protein